MDEKRRKRKRKSKSRPVTDVCSKRSHVDSHLIARFHTVHKEMDRLRGEEEDSSLTNLKKELEELGGIKEYQNASERGRKRKQNFDSSKWVKNYLKREFTAEKKREGKLRLLDVGALELNYQKEKKWIDCTSIDLHPPPQKRAIVERDFLTMNEEVDGYFDVVVLNLVINFEGDSEKRGKMLQTAANLLSLDGYLFVSLPKACILNSRYVTHSHFCSILTSLGFDLESHHFSTKLAFYTFRKRKSHASQSFPKKLLQKGTQKNNFAITLQYF